MNTIITTTYQNNLYLISIYINISSTTVLLWHTDLLVYNIIIISTATTTATAAAAAVTTKGSQKASNSGMKRLHGSHKSVLYIYSTPFKNGAACPIKQKNILYLPTHSNK